MRDIVLVRHLQKQGTTLALEDRLIHPRSPLRSALLSNLFPAMPGVSTFILNFTDENGCYQGLAQTRTRPGRPEQDVVFMAPALEYGNGSHAIWQRLLTHLCIKAGEAGHQRIYAHLKADSDALQIFKNVGFSAYAEETIFRWEADSAPEPVPPLTLRRQTAADSWSLQRLYAAVTPHAVQLAEGLAQGQWHINNYLLAGQGHRYGYVWESQGEILAVLNVHSGKGGHWFRLMIHPDASDMAAPLLSAGLRQLNRKPHQPVYCNLRTYHSDLTTHLRACGFQPVASQMVLVKHTTVRTKEFLTRLLPAFDSAVEAKHAAPTAVLHTASLSSPQNGGGHSGGG
ncbi:MAG: hypothetical protein D6796_13940 [Caldilineae bacterium]|nr:MAG: hypothetical protein D6796_13940 [Caldilineae bacterium]